MTNTDALQGKVALITGASRGIGLSIAAMLAEEGVTLFLNARNADTLKDASTTLKSRFPNLVMATHAADVADYAAVEAMTTACMERFGRIDILVNNAAITSRFALLQEIPLSDLNATIDVNLKGPMFTMRAVLPHMVHQGEGWIININSTAGKIAYPYSSVYCASKFGLTALTACVCDEQRYNNIRVIGIHPGEVQTDMWNVLEPGVVQKPEHMLNPEDVSEAVRYALKQSPRSLIRELTVVPLTPQKH